MGKTIQDILGAEKALIGMVHLGPLPGSPDGCPSVRNVVDQACRDARMLIEAGFDALLVENMHDRPYMMRDAGAGTVAAMTAACAAITSLCDAPLGVQVLAGDNKAALAIAHAVNARFIRAEGFTFSAVADEGLMAEADAGPLLRARRALDAQDVAIFADIQKKHSSHAITGDLDVEEHAKAAEFCRADGIIVTGSTTGAPVNPHDLEAARRGSSLPLLVGSGAEPGSIPALLEHADAIIVGSAIKEDGDWRNPIDPKRLAAFTSCRT